MQAPSHPFLDWPGPIAFAHRGGASDAPENTMPAFERAVELGYTYLETDVHATSDGVLVAFHDPDLSRTCDRPGKIHELPWSEVATARVRGEAPIPRLDELLHAFPGARVNIDCKTDRAVAALVSALRRAACLDRVCVGAFNDRRLRRLRDALGSGLCTSAGPGETAALHLARRIVGRARCFQVPVEVGPLSVTTSSFVRRAHRHARQVHIWTIDDPTEMHRLLDLGVDGIMTDRPAVLRDVLITRGEWH